MAGTEEVQLDAKLVKNSTLENGKEVQADVNLIKSSTLENGQEVPVDANLIKNSTSENGQEVQDDADLITNSALENGQEVQDDADLTKNCTIENGQEVQFEANLIQNSTLEDGLAGWAPFGSCTLSVHDEEPSKLPAVRTNPEEEHERKPSGRYILATGRSDAKDGPFQGISGELKTRVTYRVAGWISLGSGTGECHAVRVNLHVDGECWVHGGVVVAGSGKWTEIKGSFRMDATPCSAAVYVQGPPAGVDVRVMDLQIFAVDRKARFRHLRKKTDKVRKRDVVLKFGGSGAAANLSGASIRVMQMYNSLPFGSCINTSVIQNPVFVDFFTKHFDWAVFENELKWYHTEAQQGQLNYADADTLLDFCSTHNKPVRGHCIFWAVDNAVQQWVKALGHDDLMSAVEGRLQSLVPHYAGKFPHYDVNNEMLHGAFFQDRLGDDINAYMFRETARLDPGVTLFVNDYNVESENDPNAMPDKYIELISELQQRGAVVGGIGLQGHVTHPVGDIICDALDKLDSIELPVWITELDVSAPDESLRADDLEVVLREVYAHPAVEGIMLWGFMQGCMWRQDAYLVNADGTVNEAGQRYINLRREWTSHARGHIDSDGHFKFRGFHGSYIVELTTATGKVRRTFAVDKGDTPLVLDMDV